MEKVDNSLNDTDDSDRNINSHNSTSDVLKENHDQCLGQKDKNSELSSLNARIHEGVNSDEEFHSASEGDEDSESDAPIESDMNNMKTQDQLDFIKDREQNNIEADEQEQEIEQQNENMHEEPDPKTKMEHELELRKRLEDSLSPDELEVKRAEGQTFKDEGNKHFRSGEYDLALEAYTAGLGACPLTFHLDRAVLFSNKAVCHMKKEQFELALQDSNSALELNPKYLKALLRRAELHERLDKLDEALKDYQGVLELEPGHPQARGACMKLPEQIKDRNEKMKEEMIDKLKDLGNMVLRPFGLSTNNFQLQQDPNTGGYSVNFKQNAS